MDRLRKIWRELKRRFRTQSSLQLIFSGISFCAVLVQILLPVQWAIQRTKSEEQSYLIWIFLGAVIFSVCHRHFLSLKLRPKRFVVEERRRPMRMGDALSRLTLMVASGEIRNSHLIENFRSMLEAIKSEVERTVGDEDGVYVNASLLVLDDEDDSALICIQRADNSRPPSKRYPKAKMHAWAAMESGEIKCVSQHTERNAEYKSILCIPLLYGSETTTTALGVVTIDHSYPYAFDDVVDLLRVSLLPYLKVLELCLAIREATSHE